MSENVRSSGQPGREGEILAALREAIRHNQLLLELPPEEVIRQLMLQGLLREQPSPELVAEMMLQLRAEEEAFAPDVQPDEA